MSVSASVLIVDDDVCTRLVIEATLSRLGYRTRSAEDGAAALADFQRDPADLVITDLLMPRMNGLELIAALQAFPRTPKVIAMSGGGMLRGADGLEGAHGLGADAVGLRLKRLAGDAQVLVVTHSPQVAARADDHWRIAKLGDGDRVRTAVEVLASADREEEIARMLAGAQITDAARAAARALMDA